MVGVELSEWSGAVPTVAVLVRHSGPEGLLCFSQFMRIHAEGGTIHPLRPLPLTSPPVTPSPLPTLQVACSASPCSCLPALSLPPPITFTPCPCIPPSSAGGLLREFLHAYLPPDAHERCSGIVHIAVTRLLPYLQPETISQFKDK